jgi:hypothetical protein
LEATTSTSVEQFKQLYRIRDVRAVAIIVAVIGIGLSAAWNGAVLFHLLTGSRNVCYPNLGDKDPLLMAEAVFWIAAFVLLMTNRRRQARIAGAMGFLFGFIEIIRQATDGGEVFSYQTRPVQLLCIGLLSIFALVMAKNEPFPDVDKFMSIVNGVCIATLVLMAATKPWKESEFSIIQSGWSIDVLTDALIAMLYVGGFLLLWKNPRFLIAMGALGVGQLIATFVSNTQSSAAVPYLIPGLLTSALWIALPVALGNLVLSHSAND